VNRQRYRIAIDVRGSQDGFKDHSHRGIGRFISALAPRLPDLIQDARFFFLLCHGFPRGFLNPQRGVEEILTRPGLPFFGAEKTMSLQFAMRPELKRINPDLTIFFSHEDALLFWPGSVVFVYDLIPYRFPKLYDLRRGIKRKLRCGLMEKMARDADLIFTISETSRSDIEKFWRIPANKISVVHAAIDTEVYFRKNPEEIGAARKKYSLPDKYLLYIGGIDPRKNVGAMVKAYHTLINRIDDISLVMVGRLEGQRDFPALLELISDFGIRDKIIFPGYIGDDDLPAIYSGAEALIFPSVYEGFGLPILESLSCGTPVVASKTSAIPEAAGEMAIYCDVEKPTELARAMEKAMSDSNEKERFRTGGPRRAKMFGWDKVASRAASDLRRLLESKRKIG
jgi:glycosyltransferase involved in cell wall biosynthesis